MKSSKILRIFFVIMVLALTTTICEAQKKKRVPDEDFGLGVSLGQVGSLGGQIAYAFKDNFHGGVYFGFQYTAQKDEDADEFDSEMFMYFSPYAKVFFMDPIRHFRPFILGQFVVSTTTKTVLTERFTEESRTVTNEGFFFSLGGEWFPYPSVGVYGGVGVLGFEFSPIRFEVGIGNAFLGVEWFL